MPSLPAGHSSLLFSLIPTPLPGRLRWHTRRHLGLVAAGALLLSGAGCGEQVPDYFPLDTQRSWEYRISRTIKGETQQQKLIIANLPAAALDGAVYYPRRRLDDRIELYERTERGIFRVDPAARSRSHVLPPAANTGAQWRDSTKILFLEMTGVFSPTFGKRIQDAIELDYVIESLDETVDVAAGRFARCMRVRATGSLFAGNTLQTFLGIRFLKVEQTDWYAPGVGLVKRVRNEYTTPAEFSNQYVEELESVR